MSNSLLNAPISDVGKIQGGCRMQDIKNYFTIQLSRSERVMDKLYSKNFVRTNLIETMPSPNFSIQLSCHIELLSFSGKNLIEGVLLC